ncbi:MAG: D-glutamate deacylase, partial [Chromatocurvus sp.]
DGWREAFGNVEYSAVQWTATGERLTEETFHKYRKEQPGGTVVLHVIPESVARYAMGHPVVSIASDGMPWTTSGEHPRGAGTFGRVFGKYVREEKALDLMLAVRKSSLMPALRMEKFAPAMKFKGRIQQGMDADITVLNPDTVIDNATFADPMQYSTGFEHVLVNGTFVVRNADFVGDVFPGEGIKNRLIKGN